MTITQIAVRCPPTDPPTSPPLPGEFVLESGSGHAIDLKPTYVYP